MPARSSISEALGQSTKGKGTQDRSRASPTRSTAERIGRALKDFSYGAPISVGAPILQKQASNGCMAAGLA